MLIDAGLSGVRIERLLKSIGESPGSITAILVTHDHIDHISGVGVLSRRFDIPVFANPLTWEAMAGCIGEIPLKNVRAFDTGEEFNIKNLYIKPYPVSHDAADPVGFTFCSDKAKVAIANDLGCVTADVEKEIRGSDLLMLESNHDEEMLKAGHYPWLLKRRIAGAKGHLSNEDAGAALLNVIDRNMRAVLLGHLSRENNYPLLALETVKCILVQQGINVEKEVDIGLSFRDRASRVYTVGGDTP